MIEYNRGPHHSTRRILPSGKPLDRVPPKLPNTASRLIAMAVSLVGEPRSVALQIKCSQTDFRQYCAGRKEPSSAELHRLISLLIHEQGKLIAKNRESIAKRRAATKRIGSTLVSPCVDCFALVAAGPRTPAHSGLRLAPRPLGWARL